jgi:hypothetical protein
MKEIKFTTKVINGIPIKSPPIKIMNKLNCSVNDTPLIQLIQTNRTR